MTIYLLGLTETMGTDCATTPTWHCGGQDHLDVALPWFGPGRRRIADGRIAERAAAGTGQCGTHEQRGTRGARVASYVGKPHLMRH